MNFIFETLAIILSENEDIFCVIHIWINNFGYNKKNSFRKVFKNEVNFKYFSVLVKSQSIQDQSKDISSKIVGGIETSIEQFPWQLSLRVHGNHRCGASVISVNRVLTAAHCRRNNTIDDFTVLGGSTFSFGDQFSYIIRLEKFIQHPNFDNSTLANGMINNTKLAYNYIAYLIES